MKKIVWIFILVFFLTACEKNTSPKKQEEIVFETSRCIFMNKSGVEVAVVLIGRRTRQSDIAFPDSLVLAPDKEYGWDVRYDVTKFEPPYRTVYPPLGEVTCLKLYFDKTIGLDRFNKELQHLVYYTEVPNPEKYAHIYTYTFTEEDYQWALKNGNK